MSYAAIGVASVAAVYDVHPQPGSLGADRPGGAHGSVFGAPRMFETSRLRLSVQSWAIRGDAVAVSPHLAEPAWRRRLVAHQPVVSPSRGDGVT